MTVDLQEVTSDIVRRFRSLVEDGNASPKDLRRISTTIIDVVKQEVEKLSERKLSPCPFCGSADISISGGRGIGTRAWAVCNKCSADGPLAYRSDDAFVNNAYHDAVTLWNDRNVP